MMRDRRKGVSWGHNHHMSHGVHESELSSPIAGEKAALPFMQRIFWHIFQTFFFQKLNRIIDRILVIPPDAPPFWLSPIHRPIPCVATVAGRFGNYIVQRVIALAQLPQRDMLFWKLREHMPVLKKSNTRLAAVVIFDGSPGEVLAFSLAKHEWNMNRT